MPKLKPTMTDSRYQDMRRDSFSHGEDNDCAVVATALVCNVPYSQAHAALKAQGRKEKRGTYVWQTEKACETFGKTLKRVPAYDFIKTYPGVHSKLRNVTTHHPRRFAKCFDKNKTYLFRTERHILAVVCGQVLDWTVNKSKRVVEIYEVV